jgi:hypothetical protein
LSSADFVVDAEQPLKQWVCDKCHEVISEVKDGWIEWVRGDKGKAHSFKIVHPRAASPLGGPEGCYIHTHRFGRQDSHLVEFVDHDGMAYLIRFRDVGYLDPQDSGPDVESTRELAELMRRLTIPYYEEARLYWNAAESDSYFDGGNEIWVYSQNCLLLLIKAYGAEEEEDDS